MQRIKNKEGPDIDIGYSNAGHPRDGTEWRSRDGTERRPRDGTERKPRDKPVEMPRDGTLRKLRDITVGQPRDGTLRRPRDIIMGMPRDGTFRKPRDKTLFGEVTLVINSCYRITEWSKDVQTHCRAPSKWRRSMRSKPAFGTGKGRGMSVSEL